MSAVDLSVSLPLTPIGRVKDGFETTDDDVVYCDDLIELEASEYAALLKSGCDVFEGPWCEFYYLSVAEDRRAPSLLRMTDAGFEWVVEKQQTQQSTS